MRSTTSPISSRVISLMTAGAVLSCIGLPLRGTAAKSLRNLKPASKRVALARLAQVTATVSEEGVLIEWRTGLEIDNLGFNIYREQNGRREQLNRGIIAGSALMVGQGTAFDPGKSYSWFDPDGTIDSKYFIEDLDINGRNTLHPAITPDWESKLPAHTRSRLLNELGSNNSVSEIEKGSAPLVDEKLGAQQSADVLTTASISDQWSIATQPALKIGVRSNGWYRITQTEMAAAGFNTSGDAANLRLFVNASEIAMRVSRDSGPLSSSDYIEFWGQGVDLASTDTQIYWLVNGSQAGKRVPRITEAKIDSSSSVPESDRSKEPAVTDSSESWPNFIAGGVVGVREVSIPEKKNRRQVENPEANSSAVQAPEQSSSTNEVERNAASTVPEQRQPTIPEKAASAHPLTGAAVTSSAALKPAKPPTARPAKSPRKPKRRSRRKSQLRRNHAAAVSVAATPSLIYTVDRKARTVYATYILNRVDTENFYGEVVTSSLPAFSLTTPAADTSEVVSAQMRIILQGFTQQDHQVKVSVNGMLVDTVQFAFQSLGTKTISFPASLLNDISFLTDISVVFPHSFKAENNSLQFTAKATQTARIDGFITPNIRVFDITDPTVVQEIRPVVESSGAGYAATVLGGG